MASPERSLFQAVGGEEGCRRLSEAFYARVAVDPVLRPFFPGKTMHCAINAFAAFLVQFLGGPSEASQGRWWLSLRESHMRFTIGAKERNAWMANMQEALDSVDIREPVRSALLAFFEHFSSYVVNRGAAPQVSAPQLEAEMDLRWKRQLELDAAVAATRTGDTGSAVRLIGTSDPTIAAGLLQVMIRSGLTCEVREILMSAPGLVHARTAGRTLLHVAAAAADGHIVELLLRLGADPNTPDSGGHPPLYALANECQRDGGAAVVRTLVRAGADVNAAPGVMRCTPLHMAARRGNVEVAEALLECGAVLDVRDRRGDTPLRRAVKCRKPEVATLLRSRGANT